MEREKQIIEEMYRDLQECIDYDEWSAREYGETEVDFDTTARNLVEKGYRKEIQGKWEMVKYPLTKCSNCDVVRNCEIDTGWKYCPECGAHMKGAE